MIKNIRNMKWQIFLILTITLSNLLSSTPIHAQTLAQLETLYAQQKEEKTTTDTQIGILQQEIEQLTAEKALITSELEQTNNSETYLQEELTRLNQIIETLNNDINDITTKISTREVDIQNDSLLDKFTQSQSLTDFFSRILNTVTGVDNVLETLKKDKNQLENQLTTYLNDKVLLENKLSHLSRLHTINTMIDENNHTLQQLQHTLHNLATNINTIENTMQMTFANPTDNGTFTSYFGYRLDPFGSGATVWHSGIDIAGSGHIYAVLNGVIETVAYDSGYGNYIIINHGTINGEETKTLYAHLKYTSVQVGQTVQQKDVVGMMGTTGSSTGVHLHFEVIINGTQVNPLPYLT